MTTPTKTKSKAVLLRWSEHVSSSDVQDPLGLSLRGSTSLGSRLLHCITSITPRARYFSFIPWYFFDHQSREKGKPNALGVRDAIVLRENALTLACVTHLATHGLAGASLKRLVAGLGALAVRKPLSNLLGFDVPTPFGTLTPAEFFSLCGVLGDDLGPDLGNALDHTVRSLHPVAEGTLEGHIREAKFLQSLTQGRSIIQAAVSREGPGLC